MLADSRSDLFKVGSCNGSFSDGYRQHDTRIPEQKRGRQQKMQGSEKSIGRNDLAGKLAELWVETTNRELKIGWVLRTSTY